MSNYTEEINRRRTFAIISHPDAGKTTLTEKFLLYGGAINLAGSVKVRQPQDMLYPTGCRSRRTEVSLLPLPYYSSSMTVIVLIFWIPRDIRISRRILIVLLWQRTPQSWSLTRPRASRRRRESCSRSALCARFLFYIHQQDGP